MGGCVALLRRRPGVQPSAFGITVAAAAVIFAAAAVPAAIDKPLDVELFAVGNLGEKVADVVARNVVNFGNVGIGGRRWWWQILTNLV